MNYIEQQVLSSNDKKLDMVTVPILDTIKRNKLQFMHLLIEKQTEINQNDIKWYENSISKFQNLRKDTKHKHQRLRTHKIENRFDMQNLSNFFFIPSQLYYILF